MTEAEAPRITVEHYCPEWDYLFIRPGDREWDACLCKATIQACGYCGDVGEIAFIDEHNDPGMDIKVCKTCRYYEPVKD